MAGKVKMAPATTAPEQAPILWMMTFSPRALLRWDAVDTPTAMMAIGMAASNTCPTFSPRYAAAAENSIAMMIPHVTDQAFTSGYTLRGSMIGWYSSPSFSSVKALLGIPTVSLFVSVLFLFISVIF